MASRDLTRIGENSFSYVDVMEAFKVSDYKDLKEILDSWEEAGLVRPVKRSGKTSFTPSVFQRYRKVHETQDYSEAKREILTLNPDLNIEGYLKDPEKYLEQREMVQNLSDFLWRRKDLLKTRISVKERSFQIFGDEKFLERKGGGRVLSFNHISVEDLNYYLVYEPFFHLRVSGRTMEEEARLPVLVCENKDPWYSIALALKGSSKGRLSGIPFSTVIYGEGNKITRKQALSDFLPMIGAAPEKIYYIGDIDGQGVRMLFGAIREKEGLFPCLPLYREMLRRADLSRLKASEDQRGREWPEDFFSLFSPEEAEKLREVQKRNLMIPQEILNLSDYQEMCE